MNKMYSFNMIRISVITLIHLHSCVISYWSKKVETICIWNPIFWGIGFPSESRSRLSN